jgi:hypothetical protein
MAPEDFHAASAGNADQIDGVIDDLRSDLNGRRFADFWKGVRRVNELFKTLKPLKREDRERLWSE